MKHSLTRAHWGEPIEDALAVMERLPESSSGRRDMLLLEGNIRKLRGDEHGAISRFLEAAELDWNALSAIVEMKAEREGLERLRSFLQERSSYATQDQDVREA